jgi:hypothetical protein
MLLSNTIDLIHQGFFGLDDIIGVALFDRTDGLFRELVRVISVDSALDLVTDIGLSVSFAFKNGSLLKMKN